MVESVTPDKAGTVHGCRIVCGRRVHGCVIGGMDWLQLAAGLSRRGCFCEVQQEITFLAVAVRFVHVTVAMDSSERLW